MPLGPKGSRVGCCLVRKNGTCQWDPGLLSLSPPRGVSWPGCGWLMCPATCLCPACWLFVSFCGGALLKTHETEVPLKQQYSGNTRVASTRAGRPCRDGPEPPGNTALNLRISSYLPMLLLLRRVMCLPTLNLRITDIILIADIQSLDEYPGHRSHVSSQAETSNGA